MKLVNDCVIAENAVESSILQRIVGEWYKKNVDTNMIRSTKAEAGRIIMVLEKNNVKLNVYLKITASGDVIMPVNEKIISVRDGNIVINGCDITFYPGYNGDVDVEEDNNKKWYSVNGNRAEIGECIWY